MGRNIKCFCIVCDKQLELDKHSNIKKNGSIGMLYGGLICDTTGNYGSTIFDPITTPERLEFYVCDQCMLKKQDKVYYIRNTQVVKTFEVETFKKHRSGYKNKKAKWTAGQDKLMKVINAKNKDNIFIGHRTLFHEVIFDAYKETGQDVVYDEKGYEFYFPDVKVGVKAFEGNSLFHEQQMATKWQTSSGESMIAAFGHEVWINSFRSRKNLEESVEELKKALVSEIYRKLGNSNSSKS